MKSSLCSFQAFFILKEYTIYLKSLDTKFMPSTQQIDTLIEWQKYKNKAKWKKKEISVAMRMSMEE
jgi:hypothetical protein